MTFHHREQERVLWHRNSDPDAVITIPKTEELFSPAVAAVPLQLLAYHIARLNKCDIDQPPNLAKSVTVE